MYAEVIVNISVSDLDRTFAYSVPPELADKIHEGCRVTVPFGRGGRKTEGYVVSFTDNPGIDEERIKSIESVDERAVTAEHHLMQLAAWMRNKYGSTMIQAIKTVLPVKRKRKVKAESVITFSGSEKELNEALAQCEKKHFAARARLFSFLKENGSITKSEAASLLKLTAAQIKELEKKKLISISFCAVKTAEKPAPAEGNAAPFAALSREQLFAYEGILAEWAGQKRPCLIHGVTGSGKTLIYMKLIENMLEEGRQCILLIPEISLTWQTVRRFTARFGDKIAVMHSRLSESERSALYDRIEKDEVDLVIGPRSALFSPLKRLGLIVVDEEHDSSYISEYSPRYHAVETAIERAAREDAFVVLGSATPSLESVFAVRHAEYALFRLKERYGSAILPTVRIVDMKKELKEGNSSIISRDLADEIGDRLEKGEQTMLFINRRGHTGYISCRACGYVVKCPHCDVALTLHADGRLICHYCGYTKGNIRICPSCGFSPIGGRRAGTEQVEELVKDLFPSARVLRMDYDSTRKKDSYERILSEFGSGKADILIGTQMIVKGHDFPRVTLVGILSADTSLFAEDYKGAERTFQLISQAAGRAGRGDARGLAVVQTCHPDNPAIAAAASSDTDGFYDSELAVRSLCGYPPCGTMCEVHALCGDEQLLLTAMGYVRSFLLRIKRRESTVILGPVPETIAKIKDVYRSVLYIKETNHEEILRLRLLLEKYIRINKGFERISITYTSD